LTAAALRLRGLSCPRARPGSSARRVGAASEVRPTIQVTNFAFDQRMSSEGLAHYLTHHPEIKGIGPVKARRIVEAFGENFDRVIDEEPERVAQLAKVSLG